MTFYFLFVNNKITILRVKFIEYRPHLKGELQNFFLLLKGRHEIVGRGIVWLGALADSSSREILHRSYTFLEQFSFQFPPGIAQTFMARNFVVPSIC